MNRQQAMLFLKDFGAVHDGMTTFQKGAMIDGVLAYTEHKPNRKGQDEYDQYFQAGWMEANINLDETNP